MVQMNKEEVLEDTGRSWRTRVGPELIQKGVFYREILGSRQEACPSEHSEFTGA